MEIVLTLRLKVLPIFGNSNKAFLGVLTAKVDKGVVIKNIIDESGAQKAGLKEDDIITKFGDKEISSPDDLRNAVQSYKPGDGDAELFKKRKEQFSKSRIG